MGLADMLKRVCAAIPAVLLAGALLALPASGAWADDAQEPGGELLAAASGQSSVVLDVTYGQTEARSMLDMINAFRSGSDAWYWNSDDATKTECSGLRPLAYDYGLERIAMYRAAELALLYSHTTLDGVSGVGARLPRGVACGENIAAGTSFGSSVFNAGRAFTAWREDDEPYGGQGHRRNMLADMFAFIGIGHVACNGVDYWVQVFSSAQLDGAKTVADDSFQPVELTVADSIVTLAEATASPSGISLRIGESVALPVVGARVGAAVNEGVTWPYGSVPANASVSPWVSSNSAVAAVSDGKVVARGAGTATLSATAHPTSGVDVPVSVTVTVSGWDVSEAEVSNISSQVYDGTQKRPVPTVSLGGAQLVPGSDFTLSYGENVNAGTGSVTIIGAAPYTGQRTVEFAISKASLSSAVIAEIPDQVYAGTAVRPPVTVRLSGRLLAEGTDYSVSYSANSSVGEGVVTVTGEGNYTGFATATFSIVAPSSGGDPQPGDGGVPYSRELRYGVDNARLTPGDITPGADFDIGINEEDGTAIVFGYYGTSKKVVVPSVIDGHVIVGIGRFFDETDVEEVYLPDTVTYIERYAFEDCSSLHSVNVGSVKSSGMYMLWHCYALERLTMSDSANFYIGTDGKNVMDTTTFDNLKHIYLGASMSNVDSGLFYGDSLETVEVGAGHGKFSSNNGVVYSADGSELVVMGTGYPYSSYTVADGCVAISGAGFALCSNLDEVVIPELVTEISDGVFNGTKPTLAIVTPHGSYADYYATSHDMPVRYAGTASVPYVPPQADSGDGDSNDDGEPGDGDPEERDEGDARNGLASDAGAGGASDAPSGESSTHGAAEEALDSGPSGHDSGSAPASLSPYSPEGASPGIGSEAAGAPVAPAEPGWSMHRLYNPYTGEHFYTSDDAERDGLVELGWEGEGDGWTAPEWSNTPVFRMYNPYAGEHHYCMTEAERDTLTGAGWEYEGIGWYSDDEQRTPLYREYNPYMYSCNHNYTTDPEEHAFLVGLGWVDEGYAWYGV